MGCYNTQYSFPYYLTSTVYKSNGELIHWFAVRYHQYIDDTQLYISILYYSTSVNVVASPVKDLDMIKYTETESS